VRERPLEELRCARFSGRPVCSRSRPRRRPVPSYALDLEMGPRVAGMLERARVLPPGPDDGQSSPDRFRCLTGSALFETAWWLSRRGSNAMRPEHFCCHLTQPNLRRVNGTSGDQPPLLEAGPSAGNLGIYLSSAFPMGMEQQPQDTQGHIVAAASIMLRIISSTQAAKAQMQGLSSEAVPPERSLPGRRSNRFCGRLGFCALAESWRIPRWRHGRLLCRHPEPRCCPCPPSRAAVPYPSKRHVPSSPDMTSPRLNTMDV